MRTLSSIALDIYNTWPKMYFGASPYVQAMAHLKSINDSFYADDGRSIVNYFLANATRWKGPDAVRIKAELKEHLKTPRGNPRKWFLGMCPHCKKKAPIDLVGMTQKERVFQCQGCGEFTKVPWGKSIPLSHPMGIKHVTAPRSVVHGTVFCGTCGGADTIRSITTDYERIMPSEVDGFIPVKCTKCGMEYALTKKQASRIGSAWPLLATPSTRHNPARRRHA